MPYIREVDQELADFLKRSKSLSRERVFDAVSKSSNRISQIWFKGAAAYAAANNLTLARPKVVTCTACKSIDAISVRINVARNIKTVDRIEVVQAGTLWRTLAKTNRLPEFKTVANGGVRRLFVGGIYYYRFVIDGRPTAYRPMPSISSRHKRRDNPLILPWPGWKQNT